ncbi:hypothetical protein AB0M47_23560 [Hamadaea sp. NPDC051192]|uniref:hypothetical protein n=1 Tax=Hamadaea sp. NPDC051192 TaxID=3154940 RepID=UPI0034178B2F
MTLRWLPRIALVAVLIATSGWTAFNDDPAARLPLCRPGQPAPDSPPTEPPSLTRDACRARPTSVQHVRATPLPAGLRSPGSYSHLGATSAGPWSGVLGRIGVRDPAVRKDTLDFTAARFMARRDAGDGHTTWLEAGWAETGWSGGGRQRIYTYDTNRNSWTFFEDYKIHSGDQIWIYLESGPDSGQLANEWRAWLWWGDKWHLLASQRLPLTSSAQVEQYVEVYADAKPGSLSGEPPEVQSALASYSVPPIAFDNVQVKSAPGGQAQFWRADSVPSTTGDGSAGYCVDWATRFDTWSAGDCG